MSRYKVLLVSDHQPITGIGRYISQIYGGLRALRPENYSFELLMQNMGENFSADTPDTHVQMRLPWAKQGGYGKLYGLMAYFYYPRKMPDGYSLYHISSQMMGRSAAYQSPAVVTCHDLHSFKVKSDRPRFNQYFLKKQVKTLQRAAAIIFISQHTRNDYLSIFGHYDGIEAVIPHGASDLYQPRDKFACREELGLPSTRPIVLHVGAEADRKNIPVLFRAVHLAKKQVPDILLIRIGGHRKKWHGLVEKFGLEKNILRVKNLPEDVLAKYFNAADVFVFPSLYEGFGLPVLEALQSGCPLVVGDATSIPEIVGDSAILHHPMDADAFAESIVKILNKPALQDKYSQQGIDRARQFSWQNTAQKTLDLYRRVLE